MRIGLVIYGRIDILTGGYIYDRFLVEELGRRGHAVETISLDAKPYAAGLLDNLSLGLCRRLAERPYDMLLQDGLCHPSLLRANRHMPTRGRVPIVAIVHQVLSAQPRGRVLNLFCRWTERNYLRSVDGLLFTGSVTRDLAAPLVGTATVQHVANPGGDRLGGLDSAEPIAERSSRDGPLELLFVGNLSAVKGLLPLLQALAALPPQAWRLTVVGSPATDEPYTRRAREWTAARGLRSRVAFLGALEGAALQALYRDSQVFVMPFAHEGFGIAALEAMAFGLPVIGSGAGGIREFVRHGENGFLVARGDSRAVQGHLSRLYRDRSLLAEMSRSALDTYRRRPTWSESMVKACEFVESVARRE